MCVDIILLRIEFKIKNNVLYCLDCIYNGVIKIIMANYFMLGFIRVRLEECILLLIGL